MAVDLKLAVATGVIGLLLAVVVLYFAVLSKPAKRASGPPGVLMAGPASAGKTSLFQLWTNPNDVKETVMSVAPNHSPQFSAVSRLALVDVPGHEKLHHLTADALKQSNVQAVVYMVDASSGIAGIQAAADRLFTLLEVTEHKQIPVLVAANKFDLFNTLSVKKITAVLEEALSGLRETKSHTVPNSEEDAEWAEHDRAFLGLDSKPFQFTDLESLVEVVEGSVKLRRTSKWEEWLRNAVEA